MSLSISRKKSVFHIVCSLMKTTHYFFTGKEISSKEKACLPDHLSCKV